MGCTRSEMSGNARIRNAANDCDGLCRRTAAEPAHPADRFAREILAILERDTSRSRRLMRNSFGRVFQCILILVAIASELLTINRALPQTQVLDKQPTTVYPFTVFIATSVVPATNLLLN